MKIEVILDLPALYPDLERWWTAHGFPAVPMAVLPKLGVICRADDGQGLAAAWLYMDNSCGVSMLEWLVTNPDAAPRQALHAIRHVVGFLQSQAKVLGYSSMLATCRQPSLSRALCGLGFEVTDREVIHHITPL